ncbi:hypothetical protein GP486_004293 [Trichoglossum hirsutum]|uniref:DUF7580 domain-containing protein n=1 Tax=Trichoglossum hirsutum TaxID=265104 RepID=A0A9P8LBH2_9PEZI|nr:hypothetical protein GP486_004293 [Trichoglossum hirsutum]
MGQLEKHNSDIQTLLGNSERLEPMRRKRKSPIPKYFQQIRGQACSLHAALSRAWRCDCSLTHAAKLRLEKRVKSDKMGVVDVVDTQDPNTVKFSVFFSPKLQSESSTETLVPTEAEWYATEITMTESGPDAARKALPSTETDTRRVSFVSSGPKSAASSVIGDAPEIIDLCSALKQNLKCRKTLGYLRDGPGRLHTIDLAAYPQSLSSNMYRVLNLESLLFRSADTSDKSERNKVTLPRRTRLSIAVVLANSLLQLHTGPWLAEKWGKRDIYFFQSSDGTIQTSHPFLLYNFKSNNHTSSSERNPPKLDLGQSPSRGCNSSLLSLGILILELWFNQTIESRPFRKNFLGPDGRENEYTDFNTAQKWQEQAMEEAGLDLHNLTRRCIYCAFGAVSQDLGDDELRGAVYGEVVQPLERLLGRFEDVLA